MRRFLFLLVAVLACRLAWAYDFAVANNDGVTICYAELTPTTVAVASGNNCSGVVAIPATITNSGNTYSVTAIGEGAFSGCAEITSVTIPDSVTAIGDGAFSGCKGLTSVSIPNSVVEIGDGAIAGCSSLTSISIPDALTLIADWTFSGCIVTIFGFRSREIEDNLLILHSKSDKSAIIASSSNITSNKSEAC